MVEERLKGSIDQIDGLIVFENGTCDTPACVCEYSLSFVAAESLSQWDSRIAQTCNQVNHILDVITAKYPQLAQ